MAAQREVRAHARAESGVMLSGGQGDLAGVVLQIGHMGLAAPSEIRAMSGMASNIAIC